MEDEKAATSLIDQFTKECGTSARTFKSALIWVTADSGQAMREEARKLLAWQAIADEAGDLKLDESQKRQLDENIQKAKRDLKEAVWRSFKHVFLLGKDNSMRQVDLGLVHSSAADSPISNILNRLTSDGDLDKGISVRLLVKNWSGAFTEWPTKAVRDAVYASPQFPRILKGTEAVQDTIAKGVSSGEIAYVSKTGDGKYSPFIYGTGLQASEVEISDDVFIIRKDTAEAYMASIGKNDLPTPTGETGEPSPSPEPPDKETSIGPERDSGTTQLDFYPSIEWTGEVPPQKWMNFYTKVVSRFATGRGVRLTITLEAAPEGGISKQKLEETKSALRELGLDPDVKT